MLVEARSLEAVFRDTGAVLPLIEKLLLDHGVAEIIGGNGSGKTTFLRLVSGLHFIVYGGGLRGKLVVNGRDALTDPWHAASSAFLVRQEPWRVWAGVTVGDELRLVSPGGTIPDEASALAPPGFLDKKLSVLSYGERRLLEALKALVSGRPIVLFDEPFMMLGSVFSEKVAEIIGVLGERGGVIVSSVKPLGLGVPHRLVGGRLANGSPDPPCISPREPGLLEATGVCIRLGGKSLCYRGFSLRPGDMLVVRGPNGCGKTSLLRLLAGVYRPRSGVVRRRGETVYVPEDPGRLLVGSTPADAVKYICGGRSGCVEAAMEMLLALGIGGGDRPFYTYSYSEKRLIALAALLARRPSILLLDGGLGELDAVRRRVVEEMLRCYREEGGIVVVAEPGDGDCMAR